MQIIHLHYTYARAVVVTEPVLARAENRGSQTLTDNSTHNQGVQSMNDKTEIQHKITHLAQPTIKPHTSTTQVVQSGNSLPSSPVSGYDPDSTSLTPGVHSFLATKLSACCHEPTMRPLSTTAMRSALMTVERRWATNTIVQLPLRMSRSNASWTFASFSVYV